MDNKNDFGKRITSELIFIEKEKQSKLNKQQHTESLRLIMK